MIKGTRIVEQGCRWAMTKMTKMTKMSLFGELLGRGAGIKMDGHHVWCVVFPRMAHVCVLVFHSLWALGLNHYYTTGSVSSVSLSVAMCTHIVG